MLNVKEWLRQDKNFECSCLIDYEQLSKKKKKKDYDKKAPGLSPVMDIQNWGPEAKT